MAINKVILIGNLGQNPEVKHSASGQAICNLSVATNEAWTDKNGQKQEKTEWHRLVVFGKLAELCGQYLTKGRQIYVEGKLQTRSWQDKENQTRYTTEVVAQQIQFLGGNAGAGAGQGQARQEYTPPASNGPAYNAAPAYGNDQNFQAEPSFTEEDVPF
jgi:single-strand DNA-binding protein